MMISETIPMTIMLMPAAQGALSQSFETYSAYLVDMGWDIPGNLPAALALTTTAALAGMARLLEHGISSEEYNVSQPTYQGNPRILSVSLTSFYRTPSQVVIIVTEPGLQKLASQCSACCCAGGAECSAECGQVLQSAGKRGLEGSCHHGGCVQGAHSNSLFSLHGGLCGFTDNAMQVCPSKHTFKMEHDHEIELRHPGKYSTSPGSLMTGRCFGRSVCHVKVAL